MDADDEGSYLRHKDAANDTMIEDVQEGIKRILTRHLEDKLDGHTDDNDVILSLPVPSQWLMSFDPATTVFNRFPVGLILAFRSPQDQRLSTGVRVVRMHEMAIVYFVTDQDLDKLMRLRSRYAQATEEIFHDINTSQLGDGSITAIFGMEPIYDRPLRDERRTSYVGSVWIAFTAREDVSW